MKDPFKPAETMVPATSASAPVVASWRSLFPSSVPSGTFLGEVNTKSGLKHKAVRGSATTVITAVIATGMQVLSTMVLARLLTPRDVGLVTIILTFVLFLGNVGLNGFTEAIIQQQSITQEQLSKLFWINAGIASVLTVGFAFASIPLAKFYHEPEMKAIGIVMAFSILLNALGTVHLALLKRNMEFNIVNANSMVSKALAVVAGIFFAWIGWGYWALVASFLVLPATATISAWLYCRWRPGWPTRNAGVMPMIKFASHTLGYFSTNYVGRNLDKLLVGRLFGSVLLGNYKRAYDLFFMPIGLIPAPLTTVALASLSPLRTQPEKYQRYYLKSVAVMAFMGMGLGGLLTVTGNDVIRVLLGPRWGAAQKVFTYFAPGMGLILVYSTNGWLHLSLGRADRWFRWGMVEMGVACLFTVAGLPFGPVGVAAASTLSFLVLLGPGLSYAGSPIGLRFSSIFSAIWRYALSALLAAVLFLLLIHAVPPVSRFMRSMNAVTRLTLVSVLFSSAYLGVLCLFSFSETFGPLLDVWKMLRPKSKAS